MTEEFGSSEAGKKGGKARAEKLTPEQRSEIARRAAAERWGSEALPIATHGAPDHPLKIGDIEIPCYVLNDGRRVLVQRGMLAGLDMKQGTAGRGGGDRLVKFLNTQAINPYVPQGLSDVIMEPIKFLTHGGKIAYGYEATVLADMCDAVLDARKKGKLNYQQEHIAARCEILARGFMRVGIIALVDEATGFQRDRERDSLAKILEAFVAKEIQKYLKTFDLEFYELMCEVRGEPLERAKKRPKYFGKLTNNLVYCRLAPGVLDELKRLSPADENGRRKTKLFQGLTPDYGHPKLKEHLAGVTTALKLAKIQGTDWDDFLKLLDKTHPKFKPMPLFDGLDGE
ncbi:MAG TPA: P63C domain-containing protein [Pirellulales bacterium]|jgi:hypothetical protein|nr:P63C domain-containing protein [Pirellulales bacterium]